MSHTAHIRSHRKPRRTASSTMAMRAGVAGGVLGTLAVAGASGSANAAEPVTQTLELPTLTADLAAQVAAVRGRHPAGRRELPAAGRARRGRRQGRQGGQGGPRRGQGEGRGEEEGRRGGPQGRRRARLARRRAHHPHRHLRLARPRPASAPASGSVGSVISFLKAQVGDAYVMGATGPNAWDCSEPGAGRVQAGRRGPAARLAGPVDGRHRRLAVATSRSATSCTGVARAPRTTWASTSVTASTWTPPTRQGRRHPGSVRLPRVGCRARALSRTLLTRAPGRARTG